MNKYGIHLANGPQDIERIISCGFAHYIALEMQADYLARCPGERYLRLWHKADAPTEQIAASCVKWSERFRHIVPWNEANVETTYLGYRGIARRFLLLLDAVQDVCTLHWPALSPSQMYRAYATDWLPAASRAPIVDIHCYGSCQDMLEVVDWYRHVLPGKPLLISEFNFGVGRYVDPWWWADEALRFYEALYDRPEVIGACGFIWQWYNPDTTVVTPVDWIDQPIEDVIRQAKKEGEQTMDKITTILVDMWRRQGVNVNPDDAFFKYAVTQAKNGVFIIPQPSKDGYYYTEIDGYLVAYTFPPMYCSKSDYIVKTGLPPFL